MTDEVNCRHCINSSRHVALINEWWERFFIFGWSLENLSIPKMEGNCASLTCVTLMLLFVLKMSKLSWRLKQERNNMTKNHTSSMFFLHMDSVRWMNLRNCLDLTVNMACLTVIKSPFPKYEHKITGFCMLFILSWGFRSHFNPAVNYFKSTLRL